MAPADIALRFGRNAARSRKTSRIRRISALGLGTTTPRQTNRTVVAIASASEETTSAMGLANSPASGGDYHRPMRRKLAPRQKTSSAYSAHTAFHRPAISLALSATCNSKLARSFTSGRRSADRRESDDAKSQYSQCSCAAPASRFLDATYWLARTDALGWLHVHFG